MKRKWLIRAAVILGVCMATLLIAAPAMAMWDWCDRDPVLNIGGHTVSLDVSIKGDPQEIRGHIVFSVSVPEGTQVSVISCEPDAKVNINYSDVSSNVIPVAVSVAINTKTTFDAKLTVSLDGKKGTLLAEGDTDCDLAGSFVLH